MKTKRFLVNLLAVALLLSVFSVACSDDPSEQNVPQGRYQVVVNDFEDYKNCFQTLDLLNFFGKAERNTDPAFVYGGNASLKLMPLPDGRSTNSPLCRQYMKLLNGGENSDFTKVENILFYAYNASGTDCKLYARPVFDGFEAESKEFMLKSGVWTICVYPITEKIETVANIDKCDYIDFLVDRPQSEEESKTIYLDEVTLTYNTDKISAVGSYEPKITEDEETGATIYELNYFDTLESFSHVLPYLGTSLPETAPTLEVNTNLAYVDGHEGMSLKVTAPPSSVNDGTMRYPGFEFSKTLMENSVVADGAEDTGDYITYRVYNDNDTDQLLLNLLAVRGGSRVTNYPVTVKAKSWLTVKIDYEWMYNNVIGDSVDAIDKYEIVWEEFHGDEKRVFYFDSFEIVQFR